MASQNSKYAAVAKGAGLQEKGSQDMPNRPKKLATDQVKSKLIKFPLQYSEAFEQLKEAGKTTLYFSDYIVEALREKLQKDQAL